MKNYLVRVSFILAFVSFAFTVNAQMGNPLTCRAFVKPKFYTIKYRAAIDVLNKHLSGILIFQEQEYSSVRAVFINEIGTTFFDISFNDSDYVVNSILSSMDKKSVKRTLAKDLGMILIRSIYNSKAMVLTESSYELELQKKGVVKYYPNYTCKQYPIIRNFGKHDKVVTISQIYLQDDSMPDSIFVEHHKVHFTISLKQLHATE